MPVLPPGNDGKPQILKHGKTAPAASPNHYVKHRKHGAHGVPGAVKSTQSAHPHEGEAVEEEVQEELRDAEESSAEEEEEEEETRSDTDAEEKRDGDAEDEEDLGTPEEVARPRLHVPPPKHLSHTRRHNPVKQEAEPSAWSNLAHQLVESAAQRLSQMLSPKPQVRIGNDEHGYFISFKNCPEYWKLIRQAGSFEVTGEEKEFVVWGPEMHQPFKSHEEVVTKLGKVGVHVG